jgi:peroxiredoxin-like protein
MQFAVEADITMEQVHRFRAIAWWAAGPTGFAKSASALNAIHFSSPYAFGGVEGRWTPEDLFLSAVASCYTITFRKLAEYSKLQYIDLQAEVEGVVRKAESGYNFTEIFMSANLKLRQAAERDRAIKLLHKANSICLVARALSIKLTFEAAVAVALPVA